MPVRSAIAAVAGYFQHKQARFSGAACSSVRAGWCGLRTARAGIGVQFRTIKPASMASLAACEILLLPPR
jgi:hypothetical protein